MRVKIQNLFIYAGIMILDERNTLINTSPEYLKEKTLLFFNKLGKDEFINLPNEIILWPNKNKFITYGPNFWEKYCDIWKISSNNYEIMNIINFLISIKQNDTFNSVFENFDKYIGNIKDISDEDLSYAAHHNIIDYLNNVIFNSRYLKLKSFEN